MDIESLQFGILSPEEVFSLSVCEVKFDKPKKSDDLINTLYDPRMGPIEDNAECPTCKQTVMKCPGHFGHIVLNEHVIYPLPYGFKTVLNFLKCFCFQCSRIIFPKEKMDLLSLSDLKGIKRYNQIVELSAKCDICWNCSARIPKFFIQNPNADARIMMYYKLLAEKKSKENSIEVSVSEIERVFRGISDEDIVLFGFNPSRMRPINLILSIFPVIPPCSRPYVITNGEKCEDDLTTIYRHICKTNIKITTVDNEEDRQKEIRSLSFYISVLMDNSKGRVKHPNGRPKKGIKERLAAKGGLFRSNLYGKRVNYAGRTVVGGDPTLQADQIVVPSCIASRVTVPEVVNAYNIDKLTDLVNSGLAEYVYREDHETGQKRRIILSIVTKTKPTPLFHGDRVFRIENRSYKPTFGTEQEVKVDDVSLLQNGDRILRKSGEEVMAEVSRRKHFQLKIGDEVRRQLRDGDWVIFNRQPTLHVGSMLGAHIKVQSFHRGLGIPLNATTPQNCDFDGDELNIHVPQTLEAKSEYKELLSVKNNIISGQSSRPIMGIVQDCLVGSYLMTQGWVAIDRERFNNICVAANLDTSRFDHISQIYKEIHGTDYLYTGRGLLSMALPINFFYTSHNKAYEPEPILKIRNGVIVEGGLDKTTIGPKSGAIHHFMNKDDALNFLTRIQHIVNNWIVDEGFSVGISDCIPTEFDENGAIPQVRDHIQKCYLKAKIAEETQSNPVIAEIKVNSALNAARDVGQKLAKESLPKSNRFLPLVLSGSKGSFANITQITGLLGQQNIGGQRLEQSCLDGVRTLPHYNEKDETLERTYESRGFIRHSFFTGLNPQEFWAHAASSREGIINTALTTAKTGYCQRRITEMLKNMTIEYDHTVRNSDGRIVQFVYGGDGQAPVKQHKMEGQMTINLVTMIEGLNAQYEMDSYQQGTRLEMFRKDHQLEIQVDKDQEIEKEELSPVNSEGSESVVSIGSAGSVDYDN